MNLRAAGEEHTGLMMRVSIWEDGIAHGEVERLGHVLGSGGTVMWPVWRGTVLRESWIMPGSGCTGHRLKERALIISNE